MLEYLKTTFVGKYLRFLLRIYRAKFIRCGFCNVCGRPTIFAGRGAFTLTKKVYRNDLSCIFCNSKGRTRALAALIIGRYRSISGKATSLRSLCRMPNFKNLRIYNAASNGTIHEFLKELPNYVCSEYFPDVPIGSTKNGVRCEDLQKLSFSKESFDLMITEDVIEHVRHPEATFLEAWRVLSMGGCHIFTVPIYDDKTVKRVDTDGENDIHLLAPFYHGDPLRKEGALAYNDFGTDIVDMVTKHGFRTNLIEFNSDDRSFISGEVIVAEKIITNARS